LFRTSKNDNNVFRYVKQRQMSFGWDPSL